MKSNLPWLHVGIEDGFVLGRIPVNPQPLDLGSGQERHFRRISGQKTLNLNVCQVNNLIFLVKFKETTKISIQFVKRHLKSMVGFRHA